MSPGRTPGAQRAIPRHENPPLLTHSLTNTYVCPQLSVFPTPQAANEALREKIAALQMAPRPLREARQRLQETQNDKERFLKLVDNLQNHHSTLVRKLAEIRADVSSLQTELRMVDDDNASLRTKIAAQTVHPADVIRMNQERSKLQVRTDDVVVVVVVVVVLIVVVMVNGSSPPFTPPHPTPPRVPPIQSHQRSVPLFFSPSLLPPRPVAGFPGRHQAAQGGRRGQGRRCRVEAPVEVRRDRGQGERVLVHGPQAAARAGDREARRGVQL